MAITLSIIWIRVRFDNLASKPNAHWHWYLAIETVELKEIYSAAKLKGEK